MTEPLDRAELVRELAGNRCQCGSTKLERQSFCNCCYFNLPRAMCHALYVLIGEGCEKDWAYQTVYHAAIRRLRMSIDALITDARHAGRGKVKIFIAPYKGGGPTREQALLITNWEPGRPIEGLVGVTISASSDCIMIGDVRWAERVNATTIRLN